MFEKGKMCRIVLFVVLLAVLPVFGEISYDGNVFPVEPGNLQVGIRGEGTLNVTDGSIIGDGLDYCTLGVEAGSRGTLNVSGSGSRLHALQLIVGNDGNGSLNISDGAVAGGMVTYISYRDGWGRVNLDGGTLEATTLYARIGDVWWQNPFAGTGTINTSGYVGDLDLVFDNPADVAHRVTFTSADSHYINNVQLNISGNYGTIGGGYKGDGSVTISNGVHLRSDNACLGLTRGNTGTALVTGPDTHWELNGIIDMASGAESCGQLSVTDGAKVTAGMLDTGWGDASTSSISVSGSGSSIDVFSMVLGACTQMDISGGGTIDVESALLLHGGDEKTINITGTESMLKAGMANNPYASGFALTLSCESAINMSGGAMLALFGDGDADLSEFFTLIDSENGGEIRYFDIDTGQWENITGATEGEDYSLSYHADGEFAGFTVLTVMAVPEPATLGIFALGALAVMRRKV